MRLTRVATWEKGIGAPGARFVGEHVVVRALGGATDLFLLLRLRTFLLGHHKLALSVT